MKKKHLIIGLAVVISIIGLYVITKKNNALNINKVNPKPMEATEYYSKVAKINNVYEYDDNVDTELEAIELFKSLGFDGEVYSNYSEDGEYLEEIELVTGEDVKRPSYFTIYEANNGSLWRIVNNHREIVAYPYTYYAEENNIDIPIALSTTEKITAYVGVEKKFYEVTPKKRELKVYILNAIDSESINEWIEENVYENNN